MCEPLYQASPCFRAQAGIIARPWRNHKTGLSLLVPLSWQPGPLSHLASAAQAYRRLSPRGSRSLESHTSRSAMGRIHSSIPFAQWSAGGWMPHLGVERQPVHAAVSTQSQSLTRVLTSFNCDTWSVSADRGWKSQCRRVVVQLHITAPNAAVAGSFGISPC